MVWREGGEEDIKHLLCFSLSKKHKFSNCKPNSSCWVCFIL